MPQPFHRSRHTWLLYLAFAVFGYALNSLGPVTPFLKAELNLSYTVSSLLFSAFAAGMILAGLGGHVLVARLGRKGVLWFALFGMCLSEFGLVAGRAAWMAIASSFLVGSIGSLLSSVVPSGLSDEHGENRSISLSELNLIAAISSAAAPLLIGWFSYTFLGWRFALALPLAAALVLWLVMGRMNLLAGAPARQAEKAAKGSLPPRFWIYWVAIIFVVAIEYCMIFWCADYLEKVVGLPKAAAAQAISTFLAGMILGRLSGSRLLLRYSPFQVLTASQIIATAGFLLYWSVPAAWVGVAGLFITGMGVACQYPMILSYALGEVGGRTVQASTRASLASGIAIFVLPLVLGRLADGVGIRLAYGMVLILLVAAFAIIQVAARLPLRRQAALG
jgi:fucose permease